ncbi:MAG: hypothetical protein Q9182_001310 [Xanthomendoza sp. 2 TL-2023]
MAELVGHSTWDPQRCRIKEERRPSLYTSIRLARFVYHVKERLKPGGGLQRFRRKKSVIDLPQISLEAQARQALIRRSEVEHEGRIREVVVTVKRPRLRLEVPACVSILSIDHDATYKPPQHRLLEKLDEQTAGDEPRTSSVATCDRLFLAYNARAVTRFRGIDELRHIYDLTTQLLTRISSFLDSKSRLGSLADPSGPAICGLDHEKFLANLKHVLRCLRQAALEALIYHGLERLHEDVRRWHQRWLRDRQLDQAWFLEWPNGRRPLSTTWPWNIRPSLVVLWGVCWMFYDNRTRSVEELRQQLEDQEVASSFWPRPTPQFATRSQHPAWLQTEVGAGAGVSARRNCTPVFSTTLPAVQSAVPTTHSPYIAYYPAISSDQSSDHPLVWPQKQGTYSVPVLPEIPGSNPTYPPAHRHSAPSSLLTLSPNRHEWDDPQLFPPQHSQRQPQQLAPVTPGSRSGDTAQAYAPFLQQEASQGDNRTAAFFSPSLRPPMGPMQNYPSPHSDVSRDETRSSNFSLLPSNDVSPNMMFAASPTIASHPSEETYGQAYSTREVHRQNGGPKASYMCPHKDCKRSTGSGFSRKENLQEHLRRVHRHTGDVIADKQSPQETTAQQVSGEPRRRRRRVADEDDEEEAPLFPESKKRKRKARAGDDDDEDTEDYELKEDLSAQVQRLRKELEAKDERLRKLEQTVELLTKGGVQT